MIDKPQIGTSEHRTWLVRCIQTAAGSLGRRAAELPRAAFLALQPEDGAPWPTWRDLEACGGYASIRALAVGQDGASVVELGERRSVARENAYRRSLERAVGDAEHAATAMREALAEAVRETPPVVSSIKKPAVDPTKIAASETVALISDWHLGLEIDPLEVPGVRYDWQIAARRLGLLCEQIALFKPHHRERAALRLLLGGDVIEGELHGRSPKIEHLAQQVDGSRQLLTSAIDFLRHRYAAVHIVCTPGNHGRWTHRGPGKAVDQKWDSLVTTLYRGLEAIFRDCRDVTWNIPRTPFAEWTAPGGERCALTHGDTVINAGSPGRRVEPAMIADRVRAWNASRTTNDRIRVLAHGHTHVPYVTRSIDGVTLIGNGCGSGTAPYAQSLGVFGSDPVQVVWEAVPGHPVGDVRMVQLAAADARPELEKLIPVPQRIGGAS